MDTHRYSFVDIELLTFQFVDFYVEVIVNNFSLQLQILNRFLKYLEILINLYPDRLDNDIGIEKKEKSNNPESFHLFYIKQ